MKKVHLIAPNCRQRHDIIQTICRELEVDSDCIEQVAEMTPGYVGADLNLLCREACYLSQVSLNIE